jgi:hypothetical protein
MPHVPAYFLETLNKLGDVAVGKLKQWHLGQRPIYSAAGSRGALLPLLAPNSKEFVPIKLSTRSTDGRSSAATTEAVHLY